MLCRLPLLAAAASAFTAPRAAPRSLRRMAAMAAAPRVLPREAALPADSAVRLLSWNVLLPSSVDGWWVYKNYLPSVPAAAQTWPARKALMKAELLGSEADILCLQEASERSGLDDFDYLTEAGFESALHGKGRMRCLTLWRSSVWTLAHGPLSKDRVLVTALRRVDGPDDGPLLWVANCHLQAGPQPGRRLRQIHEAVETVRKQAVKLKADPAAHVVVCGDFNHDDVLEAPTAATALLRDGEALAGFVDNHHPELGSVTSKTKLNKLGNFTDTYVAAYGAMDKAPPTLIAPTLIPRLLQGGPDSALTEALVASVRAMFAKFAGGKDHMDGEDIDRWLVVINRSAKRGSERRSALALAAGGDVHTGFARKGEAENAAADADAAPPRLTADGLVTVYKTEVDGGKFWGVAHDLWATDSYQGCLPPADDTDALGAPFAARFDHIWALGLDIDCARAPSKTGEALAPLPKENEPSDHLPLAVGLSWRE